MPLCQTSHAAAALSFYSQHKAEQVFHYLNLERALKLKLPNPSIPLLESTYMSNWNRSRLKKKVHINQLQVNSKLHNTEQLVKLIRNITVEEI